MPTRVCSSSGCASSRSSLIMAVLIMAVLIIRLVLIMAVLADPSMLLFDAVSIQCALALFRVFACLTVSLALGTLSV